MAIHFFRHFRHNGENGEKIDGKMAKMTFGFASPKSRNKWYYLRRHIYVGHNSGDQNNGGTKIWGFYSKIPTFRTPN
ncbi:MAG: hypothetical protein GY820_35995 [Gammaproteobacteria bacterium]|nr:hypothetical protein [Gammaproteobacteria bacterium]